MDQIKEKIKKNSVSIKIVIIGVLALILLIPARMVSNLITERESRRGEVIKEITSKWGTSQTIAGPYLTIPYKKYFKNENGKMETITGLYHILPDKLKYEANVKSQIRYRGLYEAVLYESTVNITASFDQIKIDNQEVKNNLINNAINITLGVTDLKGISDQVKIVVNKKSFLMEPGIPDYDIIKSGLNLVLDGQKDVKKYEIQISIVLNGSESINFIPLGKDTFAEVKSDWKSPSFSGSFLPIERKIDKNGFQSKWKILHLNRNYPQQWAGGGYEVNTSEFGVNLIIPADVYQRSMRTSKYALMFIGFTFAAFFFSEIFNKKRVHPIQYVLIGIAIIIFYSLLISLGEHIGFNSAYLISAIAISSLISGYSLAILNNKKITIIISSVLLTLYSFMFIILQLEDYALLLGSILLLIVLAAIMYITRKIDWYSINLSDK